MAYGFDKPKMKPCLGGMKHKWTFLRNTSVSRAVNGVLESSVRMSMKGLYKCNLCGHHKYGLMDPNDTSADIRDHIGAE